MKRILLSLAFAIIAVTVNAQVNAAKKSSWIELAATAGNSQGSIAASYVYSLNFGARRKLSAGLGARFTTMFGKKVEYTTAPARLARTNATPFLVVFAGQKTSNWDTLTVQRPLVTTINLAANLGYKLSSNWSLLFNIDLVGLSFGRRSAGILTSNGVTRTEPVAKPTRVNALLTGDLDYGTLNSEFSVKYRFNDKWSGRAVYQFLFTEYTTTTISQTAPDGTSVSRFRNKANNFGLAIAYEL